MEFSLLQVKARPESVDDAMRIVTSEWSGEVIAPQIGELWSSVLTTERAALSLAPLLSELLGDRVVVTTVAGERFAISSWQPGSPVIARADGQDVTAATQLATALGKDAGRLQDIVQSSKPAAERHADAADLLGLPVPTLTGHQAVFDGRPSVQPSEFPKSVSRFRRRRRIRRIRAGLGVLQIVAFLAVDYFWFIEPAIWLVPALAVFVVNGVALLLLRRLSPPARAKSK